VTAVLLVASFLTLYWRADSNALKSEWAKIIAKTDTGQREVDFGGEVRLLGYEIQHRPSGVNLVMIWMKTNALTRIRFVHVRDDQGNVVGHGRRNHQLFMNQDVGSVFMEHVFLKSVYLRKGSTVEVGFHSKERGMARINKGPRSANGRRLTLINADQFDRISAERIARFGEVDTGRRESTLAR
jgi:hypothetical protein